MPDPDNEERTRRSVDRFLAMPAHVSALEALVEAIRPDDRADRDRPRGVAGADVVVIEANPSLVSRVMASQANSNQALINAIAELTGRDPEKDLFPGLLFGAVMGSRMQVSMRRWHGAGGETPLTEFLDQACAAIAAGLPDPGTH